MNELINHKCVHRTAPATPGLLNKWDLQGGENGGKKHHPFLSSLIQLFFPGTTCVILGWAEWQSSGVAEICEVHCGEVQFSDIVLAELKLSIKTV